MRDKPVYFHLGPPKCASTSVQAALAQVQNVNYAGFCYDQEGKRYWKSEGLAWLFDRELRFSCTQEKRSRDIIADFIAASSYPAFFSSENVTLRFLPWDLPTPHKLKFIRSVFPQQTQFIYVYKNPLALLRSVYKEWLLLGYREGFARFCRELYTFSDISLFGDICLGRFLTHFDQHIGLERLHLLYLDKEDIWARLARIIGRELGGRGQRLNVSVSDSEAAVIREMNGRTGDIDAFFDSIEFHRAYFDLRDEARKYSTARKRVSRRAASRQLSAYDPPPADDVEASDEQLIAFLLDDLKQASVILRSRDADTTPVEGYLEDLRAKL